MDKISAAGVLFLMGRQAVFCVTFLVLALSACARAPVARSGVLDLRGESATVEDGVLRLNGAWEFYWKEFLSERGPDPEGYPLEPDLVPVPASWNEYERRGQPYPAAGFASYRLRLLLDEPMQAMAFQVKEAALSYRLFVNGRLVLAEGSPGRDANATIARAGWRITEPVDLKRENEIILEVANFIFHEGGLRKPVLLGAHERMLGRQEISIGLSMMLIGALIITALFHLLIFAADPREKAALAYVALAAVMILRIAMTEERLFLKIWPGIDFELFLQILIGSTFSGIPAIAFWLRFSFRKNFNRWLLIGFAVPGAVLILLVLFAPAAVYMRTVPLFFALAFGLLAVGLRMFRRVLAEDPSESKFFLSAVVVFGCAVLNDVLYSLGLIQSLYLSQYGFFIFVLFMAFRDSRRMLRSLHLSEALTARLESSNERLLSLDRLKDDFLARTSHELRTPLQGVIGMASSLREGGADDPETREARLDLILQSCRRLSGLVNDILDFSRLRHRDIELRPGPIDLRTFVEVQLELISFSLNGREGPRFRNQVPAGLPRVLADEARLTQVFQNLLENAVRYAPDGEIRIQAEFLPDLEAVRIRLADNGTGIPPEKIEKIFQPFEQDETNPGSLGMGLAIARSLVQLHGSKLEVESRPGKTEFEFKLPVTMASPAAIPAGDIHQETRAPEDQRPPVPSVSVESDQNGGGRVLLVDDEPMNLEVLRLYLEQNEMTPILCTSVEQASDFIAPNDLPDLIVLDVMMPETSGLEFARRLRERYSMSELPILFVTALARNRDLVAALNTGANDYLTKPFEREEFLSRVTNLARLSRAHRKNDQELAEARREASMLERSRINNDLHDHLGASLVDLKVLAVRALKNPEEREQLTRRIDREVSGAMQILRNDLENLRDLDMLEESFFDGLRLILLRRYVAAGREIVFEPPDETPLEGISFPRSNLSTVFAVAREVATNDIKYGAGTAHWGVQWLPPSDDGDAVQSGPRMELNFSGFSRYHLSTHRTGQGTAGMLRRLSEIGGTLSMALEDRLEEEEAAENEPRPIQIRIIAPLYGVPGKDSI